MDEAKQPVTTQVDNPTSETESSSSYMDQLRSLKAELESVRKQLAEEQEKATQYMNDALRAKADVANTRRRLQQDMALAMQETLKSVVYQQLSVLDSFDRAFSTLPKEFSHFTWVDGVAMIQAQLSGILQQTGVIPIDTQGKQFDPLEHEAVAYEETRSYAEGMITTELQRGYKLQGQVLRPALVKVARAAPSTEDTSNVEEQENIEE